MKNDRRFYLHIVVLLFAATFCGCGESGATGTLRVTERTTPDGTTICELDVKDRSLKEVCGKLSGKLDKPIRLDTTVDPERHIENMHIETNDWDAVLNGFVKGLGNLSVTVSDNEILLSAE